MLASAVAAGATVGVSGVVSTLAAAAASSFVSQLVSETRRRRPTSSPYLRGLQAPATAHLAAKSAATAKEAVEEDDGEWAIV